MTTKTQGLATTISLKCRNHDNHDINIESETVKLEMTLNILRIDEKREFIIMLRNVGNW